MIRDGREATAELGAGGSRDRRPVPAATVFAVTMTFIDQAVVAIAIPKIQRELSLSATGSQWAIDGEGVASGVGDPSLRGL